MTLTVDAPLYNNKTKIAKKTRFDYGILDHPAL
jgi:hypothetical protein